MATVDQPVTFTPEQVAELSQKLADFRHDLNNHLALIISAAELIKRKPDVAVRMADALLNPPKKILEQIRNFSADFDRAFGITRE